jgi:hypothetical protein
MLYIFSLVAGAIERAIQALSSASIVVLLNSEKMYFLGLNFPFAFIQVPKQFILE